MQMNQDAIAFRQSLRTPRAAAIAGIIFSVLMFLSLTLIRLSVPADPAESGAWLANNWRKVELALNMIPFAGIAFLWFIAVVRDRLGEREDRFFSTVFLGSGLLFLAMLFAAAAIAGGIMYAFGASPRQLMEGGSYGFGRAITYEIVNVYAMKMAGVFMISTCTLGLRTGIFPRWLVYLGYVFALSLMVSLGFFPWIELVVPLWVFMISVYILIENHRRPHDNQP